GSGFLTACLARLARAVTSIDLHADLIDGARARLIDCGAVNVKLDVADAMTFEPHHQFDAVCVTAAVAEVPAQFLEWLKPDGRMFIVRGISPAQQALRMTRRGAGCHTEQLFETDIPYLRGAAPVPRFAL
ncbi:MAG: methyltransferase domain-containing protein, partial [Lysobacteraceae bacterium]